MPEEPDAAMPPATEVVAIDGPSGAGKSTVARRLARRLGFHYLDTGAMYRAVTWYLLEHGLAEPGEDPRIGTLLEKLELRLLADGSVQVNGRDVTAHLRSREVESRVSAVSARPEVRRAMRRLQRELAARGPIVAEGRDMGSVVFPRARWKFYLDAEPRERARRRLADFRARGREVTEQEVLDEIAVRDALDSTRRDAPLVRAPDAEYVDTTGRDPQAVVEDLERRIRAGSEPA